MYARLSRFAGLPPERIQKTMKEYEENELRLISDQPGFKGTVVMVNHSTGQAAAITFWEKEADMRASERAAGQAVQAAVDRAGPSREPIIDRFEVVLQR